MINHELLEAESKFREIQKGHQSDETPLGFAVRATNIITGISSQLASHQLGTESNPLFNSFNSLASQFLSQIKEFYDRTGFPLKGKTDELQQAAKSLPRKLNTQHLPSIVEEAKISLDKNRTALDILSAVSPAILLILARQYEPSLKDVTLNIRELYDALGAVTDDHNRDYHQELLQRFKNQFVKTKGDRPSQYPNKYLQVVATSLRTAHFTWTQSVLHRHNAVIAANQDLQETKFQDELFVPFDSMPSAVFQLARNDRRGIGINNFAPAMVFWALFKDFHEFNNPD